VEYLYQKNMYGIAIIRYPITRETENNYWININGHLGHLHKQEEKINKKTMSIGHGYEKICYYKENPKLLKEYEEEVLKAKFLNKLGILKSCTNIDIIKQIIDIKIGE